MPRQVRHQPPEDQQRRLGLEESAPRGTHKEVDPEPQQHAGVLRCPALAIRRGTGSTSGETWPPAPSGRTALPNQCAPALRRTPDTECPHSLRSLSASPHESKSPSAISIIASSALSPASKQRRASSRVYSRYACTARTARLSLIGPWPRHDGLPHRETRCGRMHRSSSEQVPPTSRECLPQTECRR